SRCLSLRHCPSCTYFTTSSFFFQAEDGIRDRNVTGVQTCALPISPFYRSYPQEVRPRPILLGRGGSFMSLVLGRSPIPPRRRSTVPVVPGEGGTGRTRSNTLGHGADNDLGVPVFCAQYI